MTRVSPTAVVETATDVISLATGDVRFEVHGLSQPPSVRYADQAYPTTAGSSDLRAAVARYTRETSDAAVGPDDVVVTPGARLAIMLTLRVATARRPEVLLPAPYWSSYPEVIKAVGGVPVVVPGAVGDGRIDVDTLESFHTPATGAVVVNSPRNPDGAVTPADDIEAVLQWAARHEVTVLCDQVYRGLSGADRLAPTPLDLRAEIPPHCAVVDGLTKSGALAGLRIGWVVAGPPLRRQITALASHLLGGVCSTAQEIAVAALTDGVPRRAMIAETVERNVREAVATLDFLEGVRCPFPEGGLFVFPDVRGWLAGAPADIAGDVSGWLRRQHQVAVVDGAAFGAPGHFRLCAGVPADHLGAGLRRLAVALSGDAPGSVVSAPPGGQYLRS